MNGPQDMGGMMGFGPVALEPNEPLFHAAWERRALGLSLAIGATGSWTIDQSRHERELLPPDKYWSLSYYEIWIAGLQNLLVKHGLATTAEIDTGKASVQAKPVKRVLHREHVAPVIAGGSPYNRKPNTKAKFSVGDGVRTINIVTKGHTRLPTYAKRKSGVIRKVHGCHVFPDSSGLGQGENPHWLYNVEFTAAELFGSHAKDRICIDLWEPYLEQATS
jgi:nitrile hydratase subunit beta